MKVNEEYYKNILDILVDNSEKYPDKIIFEDNKCKITYKEFVDLSMGIGRNISMTVNGCINRPIAVYSEQNIKCLASIFGILFSGNFYTILDIKSPKERMQSIIDTLNPVAIITTMGDKGSALELGPDVLEYDELCIEGDYEELSYKKLLETDPIYVLFTSGSTGVPKGTAISHRSVMAYANSVIETFNISENTVLGNQTPFYFSMSVLDIYVTVVSGASMYIIPKILFSFPKKLIEKLNEKKVNMIYWVPSAMNIVTRFKTFETVKPQYLKWVMFAGETMPVKCVRYWQENLQGIKYANLFGPTEITDTCTFHVLDRIYSLEESIPIGKPFTNCEVLIVNDDNELVENGKEGELLVKGPFVGLGYYNNIGATVKAFVQNPVNTSYSEIVYRTGDRVKYNEEGELLYLGRKDFQIKHMGHRIELGEIERATLTLDTVENVACVYLDEEKKIVLFVESKMSVEELEEQIKTKVPKYMIPQEIFVLKKLPLNANGKIDRIKLKEERKK